MDDSAADCSLALPPFEVTTLVILDVAPENVVSVAACFVACLVAWV